LITAMSSSGKLSNSKESKKSKRSGIKFSRSDPKPSNKYKPSEINSDDELEMDGMYGYKNTRWVSLEPKEDLKDDSDYGSDVHVNPYQVDSLPPLRRPVNDYNFKGAVVYKPDNTDELKEYLHFVKTFMDEQYMINDPMLVGATGFEERALQLLSE